MLQQKRSTVTENYWLSCTADRRYRSDCRAAEEIRHCVVETAGLRRVNCAEFTIYNVKTHIYSTLRALHVCFTDWIAGLCTRSCRATLTSPIPRILLFSSACILFKHSKNATFLCYKRSKLHLANFKAEISTLIVHYNCENKTYLN